MDPALHGAINRARIVLGRSALSASFPLSPEELSEKAKAQARNDEGQFVEEAPVKAHMPEGGGSSTYSSPTSDLSSAVRAQFLLPGDLISHEGFTYEVDGTAVSRLTDPATTRIFGRRNGEGESGLIAELPGDQFVSLVETLEIPEPEPGPESDWRAEYEAARAGLPEDMSQFGLVPVDETTVIPSFRQIVESDFQAVEFLETDPSKLTPKQLNRLRVNIEGFDYMSPEDRITAARTSAEEMQEQALRLSQWQYSEAGITAVPDVEFDTEGNQVPGPTARAHLEALLATGAVLDAELERRIAARQIEQDESVQRIQERRFTERIMQVARNDLIRAERMLEQERQQARDRAHDDAWREIMLDPSGQHARRRPFASTQDVFDIAEGIKRSTPERKALAEELRGRIMYAENNDARVATARRSVEESRRRYANTQSRMAQTETALPGTQAYTVAQRQESIALIGELREMGGTAQVSMARVSRGHREKVQESLRVAFDSLPTEWLADLDKMGIEMEIARRGFFKEAGIMVERAPQIGLSLDRNAPETQPFRRVATHEFGHAVADRRKHISTAEWAMSHHRSPRASEDMVLIQEGAEGAEQGFSDEWSSTYTGRVYDDRAESQWEIFTTGLESLLTGSDYFQRLMEQHGFDAEFRAFILALMAEA